MMGPFSKTTPFARLRHFLAFLVFALSLTTSANAWWNPEWTIRKQITIDTTAEGGAITDPIGTATVLVRLHDGNYQFLNGREDGNDIRFVAGDDKTVLSHHIERYDGLLNEAFVWVKVPDLKPGEKRVLWLYYGNQQAGRVDAKDSYDSPISLVYHFNENGVPAADATGKGNTAENGGILSQGALIAGGLRTGGASPVTIPATPKLEWTAGASWTWSAWVRLASTQPNSVIFSRRSGDTALVIGADEGVPFVEVSEGGSSARTATGAALGANVWRHLAVVAEAGKITLYIDGEIFGTVDRGLPALNTPLLIGGDSAEGAVSASAEIDELRIASTALAVGLLKIAAIGESGSEKAGKLIALGSDEASAHSGGSATLEHVMLFGDIARNMMFDGWVAIGICAIMIVLGWGVAIKKFSYLNSIQKGTDAFLQQWKKVSSDLTVLDHGDEQSIKTMGGKVDSKTLRHMHRSPLYHLYHIGSEEIRHRVGNGSDRAKGLSARSIQAIRASLETGLVHENQRMNKGLVFLTISIAGGPYVGLLGTVVGVMITFAIIAKSGEVDVNSIAPGIASALLATVAGLVVAIPALFIYSYLSSRIKDLLAGMQVFIDEFIAKMAEFYPTPADVPASRAAVVHPRSLEPQPTTANHHAS